MKILYVTPFHDNPPHSGAALRSWNIADHLRRYATVDVIAALAPACSKAARPLDEGSIMRDDFFTPINGESVIRRMLTPTIPGFGAIDRTRLRAIVHDQQRTRGPYDVIFFATQLTAGVLPLSLHFPKVIIDLYDYYTPMYRDKVEGVQWYRPYHWIYRREFRIVAGEERRVLAHSSTLLVTNQADAEQLGRLYEHAHIHVVPNGAPLPDRKWSPTGSQYVVMVGNFEHHPNVEGLTWFLQAVWPKVLCDRPEAELHVVGRGMEVIIHSDYQRVWFKGVVEDLDDVYEHCACCIIPILSGGGTRLKLIEAMMRGVPAISTTRGAEGIHHHGTVTIEDDPTAFAAAVCRAISGDGGMILSAERAAQIARTTYSWDAAAAKLETVLAEQAP